jgi:hydroxyacylglutathione hydrolase
MKLVNNLFFYPETGMMDSNTYVIKGSPGIIIDPGSPPALPARIAGMKKDGIDPIDIGIIINTHLHIDHCSANESFKALSGAKIALHPVQKENYQAVVVDGTHFLGSEPIEFKEDYILSGNTLISGDIKLEMITAPGHSPDCVCFYDAKNKALFCGDVLFDMNTGRVDLPGGSAEALKKSILSLAKLDIEYLLPGHMDPVIGKEKNVKNFEIIRLNVFPWL